MICRTCASAADMLIAPDLPEDALARADQLHDQCPGCCCQHVVPHADELAARRARRGFPGLAATGGAVPAFAAGGRIA